MCEAKHVFGTVHFRRMCGHSAGMKHCTTWRFEGKARQLPRVRGLIMWEYEGFERMGDSSYQWYPSMAVVVS